VAVSLLPTGSVSFPTSEAVLEKEPTVPGLTIACRETVWLVLGADPPRLQVTVPPPAEHAGGTDTSVRTGGIVSLSVTPEESEGPRLRACSV
jgi:hypothetical protein